MPNKYLNQSQIYTIYGNWKISILCWLLSLYFFSVMLNFYNYFMTCEKQVSISQPYTLYHNSQLKYTLLYLLSCLYFISVIPNFFNYFMTCAKQVSIHRNKSQPCTIYCNWNMNILYLLPCLYCLCVVPNFLNYFMTCIK